MAVAASIRAGAQETTQEILVGYNSEQDRREGEKQLAGVKDKLNAAGQNLESLQLQAISDKALKLKVGLPQTVKAEISHTPIGRGGGTQRTRRSVEENRQPHRLCPPELGARSHAAGSAWLAYRRRQGERIGQGERIR